MIGLFIPSKDRVCQLRLLLESMKAKLPSQLDYEITIAYEGKYYDKLKKEEILDNIIWRPKESLDSDMLSVMENPKYNLFWMIADDNVFIQRYPISALGLKAMLEKYNAFCISPRCGRDVSLIDFTDTTHHHLKNFEHILDDDDYEWIIWKWREQTNTHFAFPTTIDGGLYRREFILGPTKAIGSFDYRRWECKLHEWARNTSHNHEYCISPEWCTLLNIPMNQVVDGHNYIKDIYKYSTDELNDAYHNGYVIDYQQILKVKPISVQQQVPITMIKHD